MKKYTDQLTPEQRDKYKDNTYFKLLDNATYSDSKKGEVKIFKTSSRESQSKRQLPLENIESRSWIDGKVIVIYKDGTKLTANTNEIEFVSDYKNESDIPLNDHCL